MARAIIIIRDTKSGPEAEIHFKPGFTGTTAQKAAIEIMLSLSGEKEGEK